MDLGEAKHGHKMDGKKVWEFDLGLFFRMVYNCGFWEKLIRERGLGIRKVGISEP